jgi:hypothetical protein
VQYAVPVVIALHPTGVGYRQRVADPTQASEEHLDLDGRVTARVQDLASAYSFDCSHNCLLAWFFVGFAKSV